MFPLAINAEIPRAGHPGSFGFQRKNHIHEGIDLYGNPDDPVFAICDGEIANIYHFTGASIGMPWWNETMAVAVQDDTGIWVYGEIEPAANLSIGRRIAEGDRIGNLVTVLKKDKGRPMTMLHIERWKKDTMPFSVSWDLNAPQPEGLLDPTLLLQETLR